jgi:cytochrome c
MIAQARTLMIAGLAALIGAGVPSPLIAGEETVGSDPQLIFGRDLYEGWCSNCHSSQPGGLPFAAPLDDLYGRKAGTHPGFAYSPEITGLDLVWGAESLDAWLAGLATESPTTSIRHLGIGNPRDRAALVAWLSHIQRSR